MEILTKRIEMARYRYAIMALVRDLAEVFVVPWGKCLSVGFTSTQIVCIMEFQYNCELNIDLCLHLN